jgi:hypothetical protein
MKTYQATILGRRVYTFEAPNIQAASQFVKHWPGVTLRRM